MGQKNFEVLQLQRYRLLFSDCHSSSSISYCFFIDKNFIHSSFSQFIVSYRDVLIFLKVKWNKINDILAFKNFRDINVFHTFIHKIESA